MSIYGPAVQSLGSILETISASKQADATSRAARQRAAIERNRIDRQYEYLRAKNRTKRVKQGISLESPVVQILEMQSERDKFDAVAEATAETERQLQEIVAVEQARKYASMVGIAEPWLAYEQRQETLRIRKETDEARLETFRDQNAYLKGQLGLLRSALSSAVPSQEF